MKNMYLSKKISDGVSGFLKYHFACERGRVMNESFLLLAMADIINSSIDKGNMVKAGYAHHALNSVSNLGGRKRELDYAVFDFQGNLSIVAEAKWAGSSHCTFDNLIVDLFRLGLVKNNNQDVKCYFVLAGHSSKIKKLVFDSNYKPGSAASPIYFLNLNPVCVSTSGIAYSHAKSKINPNQSNVPNQICTELIRNGAKLPINSWERFECFVWEISV
ncbi:hypothetical protein [Chromobacterium amazonense]|uniref:hypothetical protein n=1 Tax=Chromobacterium amazonense TaxID=1382803 RepID=UPI0031F699C8